MSKREYRRFTAEQKLEILREVEQPGVKVREGCAAGTDCRLGAVSLAIGSAERVGCG